MKPRTIFLLAAAAAYGCQSGPARRLVRVQAFYCSERGRAACDSFPRGAPIPRDSMPPGSEAFQVWAWHPGRGKVVYRTEWRSPFFLGDTAAPTADRTSGTEFDEAGDSSMVSYNFAQAAKTRYVLRVLLEGRRGKILDQDSLVWDFGSKPGTQSSLAEPAAPLHSH